MQDPPGRNDGSCVYLMQFTDGNRIDLGIYPAAKLDDIGRDSLSVLLLDKDGIIEPFGRASENDYLPKPPTAKAFSDCTNEFWWVCPYVAKGLWRAEIIYAKHMLDVFAREQLMKMLRWHIGVKTRFSRNPGKLGKYFQQYLEPELWNMLREHTRMPATTIPGRQYSRCAISSGGWLFLLQSNLAVIILMG